MLAQRDLDLHPRIGVVAEDLDHLADGLGVPGGLLDDLDHHHLPGHRLLGLDARRQQDLLGDPTVFGHHQGHTVLDEHAADHAGIGTLEHFDDLALRAPPSVEAGDADHHPVTVQHFAHFVGAEEEIRPLVVGDHETIAFRMALDGAADQVGLGRQQIGAATIADHLPVTLHREHPALEELALDGQDVHRLGQLSEGQGHPPVGEHLHDELPAGEREIVFVALPLVERIALAEFARLLGIFCFKS